LNGAAQVQTREFMLQRSHTGPLAIRLQSSHIAPIITGFCAALFILNAALFTYAVACAYPIADKWRFLEQVIVPFYQGDFEIRSLFLIRHSGDHSQPIHKMLGLVIARVFDLNYRVESAVGFGFMMLTGVLLLWHYWYHFRAGHSLMVKSVGLVILASIMFSLASPMQYAISLVTLLFMPIFVTVATFIFADQYLRNIDQPRKETRAMILFFLLILVNLFLGDGLGLIGAGVVMCVLIITMLTRRSKDGLLWIICLTLAVVTYLLIREALVTVDDPTKSQHHLVTGGLQNLFRLAVAPDFPLFRSLLLALAGGIVPYDRLSVTGLEADAATAMWLGGFVLALHGWCWYIFFRRRMYRETVVPPMLLLFSYGLIVGILAHRVPASSIMVVTAPRYYPLFQLAMFSCVWIVILHLSGLKMMGTLRHRMLQISVLFIALLFLRFEVILANSSWTHVPSINRYFERYGQVILSFGDSVEKGRAACVRNFTLDPLCRYSPMRAKFLVDFLKENELSIYSKRPDTMNMN
jgi:hypothetical protein